MESVRKFMFEAFRIPRGIMEDLKKYPLRDFLWRMYSLREAWYEKGSKRLVGEDKYGNKYWETDSPTELNRERWVEYPSKHNRIYDASDIPAEWHMWLHRNRDEPPTKDEAEGYGRNVVPAHTHNRTGEEGRYYVPGHFFNPAHRNSKNISNISAWDPNNPKTVEDYQAKKPQVMTKEPI